MNSWLALVASMLAGVLAGWPVARRYWSQIEEAPCWAGWALWLDGWIYGAGAGSLVWLVVSLALLEWLAP